MPDDRDWLTIYSPGEDWWPEDRVTAQLREVEKKPPPTRMTDEEGRRILRKVGILKDK